MTVDAKPSLSGRSLIWFYVGAFVGPFGFTTASVLLTTLQGAFHTDLKTVTLAVSAYMVAYAVCLLFSGAISDTVGARWAICGGCAILGLASLICVFAPTVEVFLIGRTLQGVGNAFTTALLMAALGEIMPSHRLGQALGFFAAFQMAGSLFGPLGGGLAAQIDWRLSFLLVALVAALLTASYWRFFTRAGRGIQRRRGANPIRLIASVCNVRMGLLCLASFFGYLGAPSIGFLMAIHLQNQWAVSPAISGLILAGFGLVNVLAAPKAGSWVDSLGRSQVIVLGAAFSAILMVAIAVMPSLIGLAGLYALLGLPTVMTWTALGTVAVEAFPEQRGAATSIFNSAKFAGVAAAPALYMPVYLNVSPALAFALAGGITALLVVPSLVYQRITLGQPGPLPRPASRTA